MSKPRKLRVFTSFSGYDSQCLALNRLKCTLPGFDYELVGWSEIDKYAIRAHNVLFPEAVKRNYGDISKIKWGRVPNFDLFTMSSPCQDFSAAGRRRGGDEGQGTRSSLLWECKKAIIAKRPKYILFENVKALVSKRFLAGFERWQQWLEEMGYTNTWQVLNATDCDVPQKRQRVFMVSILDADKPFEFPEPKEPTRRVTDLLMTQSEVPPKFFMGKRREDLLIRYVNSKFPRNSSSEAELAAFNALSKMPDMEGNTVILNNPRGVWGEVRMSDQVAPTMISSSGPGAILVLHHDTHQLRYLTPHEWFRLMDLDEDDINRLETIKLSSTQRAKMAGNSIVVACIHHVLHALFSQEPPVATLPYSRRSRRLM